MNTQSGRIASTLAQQAAQGASVDKMADTVVATWAAVESALAPIIGPASVAVLYMRARHLASRAHPWLLPRDPAVVMDLPALRSLLVQQDVAIAAAGGGALLQAFHELLASLVGASLTARLLDPVWNQTSGGVAAQDSST